MYLNLLKSSQWEEKQPTKKEECIKHHAESEIANATLTTLSSDMAGIV